jgi:transposase-like protein
MWVCVGLTTGEREELRELRQKVRRLEREREILKRAAVGSTRQRNAARRVAAGVW